MLMYYTLPEALGELARRTGRPWTESELFDTCLRGGVQLHAAPPRAATVTLWEFVIGEGMVAKHKGLGWSMAILYPAAIAELWQAGETETVHATGLVGEDQYRWFADPVLVRNDNARVSADALAHIIKAKSEPQPEAAAVDVPLGTRERNTLLCIIGVLCKEAKIEHSKAAKAASLLASTAASMGVSLAESTIELHLKKVVEALGARTK